MKTLTSFCLLLAGSTVAQTTLIAHKSHSGTKVTYATAAPGNFGMPSSRLIKVTKVNDTAVVLTSDRVGRQTHDTVYNHPVFSDPNIPVDSMKKMYWEEVKFENFDRKPIEQTNRTTGKPIPETVSKPTTEQPEKKHRKKRKSELLWLWIIGGGTFTGMLLISRKWNRVVIKHA